MRQSHLMPPRSDIYDDDEEQHPKGLSIGNRVAVQFGRDHFYIYPTTSRSTCAAVVCV